MLQPSFARLPTDRGKREQLLSRRFLPGLAPSRKPSQGMPSRWHPARYSPSLCPSWAQEGVNKNARSHEERGARSPRLPRAPCPLMCSTGTSGT